MRTRSSSGNGQDRPRRTLHRHDVQRPAFLHHALRSLVLPALACAALWCIAPPAPAAAQTAPPADVPGADEDAIPAPCEDFYAWANADWFADATAPATVFAALQATSLERQRALLDAAASAPTNDTERLLGTFWRAANDEAAIEAAGLAPLKPWLERIEAVRRPRDIAAVIAQAHAAGLPLLFRFDVGTDLRAPESTIVYTRQAGLALPDRDYYLRDDPTTESLRTHYRAYVARLLALSGTPAERVEQDVAAILDIETRLARASLSRGQLRDPANSYYPTQVADAARRLAALDWKGFLRAQGLRRLRSMSMAHNAFFVEANHLIAALPPAQWRPYLRFHAIHALAPHLPRAFRDAHHALFGRQLQGIDAAPARWQAALAATDAALGEWLGERYAAQHLDAALAGRTRTMADALVAALRQGIAAADWLGAAARASADAKLDVLELVIGHEDPAPAAKPPALAPDAHAANVLALAGWRQRAALAALGQPPAPAPLRGHHVNAFYDPAANRLAVSAAMLAPPLLAEAADAAHDYAALGTLLGHELAHAVDPQGAGIDAGGEAAPWWSAEDFQRFTERTRGLVEQYDGYRVLADVHVDGRRTYLENLADLAGLELAWAAFRDTGGAAAEDTSAGADAARRFFQHYARTWRQRLGDTELRLALATGVRTPPPYRVLGPLANSTPFATTYGCDAEGFVRAQEQRLRVWR